MCYVLTWFSIKGHESIVNGSKHLFGLIQRCEKLYESTRQVVKPVIKNNGYFAHSECLLLSMIVDQNVNLRKLAVLRILKARKSENVSTKRSYRIPSINFEAVSYRDISWQSEHMKNVDSVARCTTLKTGP